MKNKKKKSRKKKFAPPLSKIDNFLYTLILIVFIAIDMTTLVVYLKIAEWIAFSVDNVVAYSVRGTVFLSLPLFFVFVIATIGYFGNAYNERRPILGNKKVNYKSTANYESVQFLFRKSKKTSTENEKKLKSTYIKIFSIIVSLFFVLSLGGLFGRNTINESGEIKSYSIFNTVKNEWFVDDVSSLNLNVGLTRTGYRSVTFYPTLWVKFNTDDDREFTFEYYEIYYDTNENERIYTLSKLLKMYEDMGIPITTDGDEYLEEFIEHYDLTGADKNLFLSLFGK